jgi:hypothetical protein
MHRTQRYSQENMKRAIQNTPCSSRTQVNNAKETSNCRKWNTHTLITHPLAGQHEVLVYSLASSFSHSNEAFSPLVTAPRINHQSHVNVFTDTFMLHLAACSIALSTECN